MGEQTLRQRSIRVGARGSALAQAQATLVSTRLQDRFPQLATELTTIRTNGDLDQTSPLTVIGGQGVFTSAIQRALLAGEIDLAVHSAKDLPSTETPGLTLVFPLPREDVRDVVVSAHGGLAELPPSPRIGTSSRRRAAQLRVLRPDAQIVEIRGNVDTRLRKAEQGEYDAIVLAAAGLHRMGWQHRITEYLPVEQMVPAPGQGALAVEICAADTDLLAKLHALGDAGTAPAVRIERAFLRAIGAGCAQPVAAYAEMRDGELHFEAMLASDDGSTIERRAARLDPAAAEEQAADIARQLMRAIARRTAALTPQPPRPIPGEGRTQTGATPPAGWSVLVTRPAKQAAPLINALRAAGAEPVAQPAIRIEPPNNPVALNAAVTRLVTGAYAWVVFTSINGVEAVLERLKRPSPPNPPLPIPGEGEHSFVPSLSIGRGSEGRGEGCAPGERLPRSTHVAAVGPSTAAALAHAGITVDLVPEQHDGEGLLAALVARGVAGKRILLPRADIGREVLPAGLRQAGALVDDVAAYRTVTIETLDPDVKEKLRRHEIGAVTFASGSSVRGLLRQLGDERLLLDGVAIVCIGQTTAAVAHESGLMVAAIADEQSNDGLVRAVIAARQAGAAASERTS